MKTATISRLTTRRFNFFILMGVLILAVAAMAVPFRSASSSAPGDARNGSKATNSSHAARARVATWVNPLAPMFAGETVDVYASDCVTPKLSFNLGETVCAKTNGIDLSTPGNYYMNWVDSQLNQTNGGTITQNPQYFLFVPPTADTWKATVGRVAPADSSIIGNPPIFTVSEGPALSTFAADCSTPKTTFTLGNGVLPGETVCARVSGVDPTFNRRLAWIDPAGNIRKFTTITSDPQTDSFTLPTDEFDPDYQVDNRGVWKVNVISSRGTVVRTAAFNVQAQTPVADLSVGKSKTSGDVKSGDPVTFRVSVYNRGPNDAANVELADETPANATFVSVTPSSGSGFSCTGTTTVTCTGAVLKVGDRVAFDFVYTAGSQGQTITNTATASSDTAELNESDNSSTDGPYTIGQGSGGGGGTCSLACSDDITTPANTVDQNNNSGAVVHFAPPSANDECGTVTVDHCNDCFFPEGSTVVTASSTSGDTCSFTVTVTPPGSSPTISCPGNKTADADANVCSTSVNVGTATATGSNVTVVGFRSDGQPMYTCDAFGNCTRNSSDAPFNAGTTTITWYAYAHDVPGPYTGPVDGNGDPINAADTEEGHRTGSATCSQTVVVNDVTPPNIAATDSTVSADENCEAVIPDYSNTVTDNCACGSSDTSDACQGHPHITYSQTPAAGTVVGLGPHTVHIEATDGSSNNNGASKDVTFTVNDTTAPVITCPSNITGVPTETGTCAAHVDPGTATATDNCDSTPTITASRSDGRPLTDTYPRGTTTITWTATDDAGNHSSCDQTITVVDNEPPVIVFNGQTPSMWPPNHRYQTFGVTNFVTSVTDNCDSISVSSVYITKVTSDEIENGNGDGNTLNDIVIAADCKSVQLRSEREGTGNGRVYTIFFSVADSSGNIGTGTAKVVVKHNPGEAAVDSGPHYTITSSCP